MSVSYGAPTVGSPAAGAEAPPARRGISRSTVLKLAVTAALSAYVVWQAGLADALGTLLGAEWRWVTLAACSAVLAMVLNVKRWQIMLDGQGGAVALASLVRLYLIGMFFNNVLPSRLGGDVVRAYGASLLATTKTRSVAAILMDRLVGAVSVLILGVVAVVLYPSVIPWQLRDVLFAGLVVAVLALGLLLYRGARLGSVRATILRLADVKLFGLRLGPRVEAAIDAVRSYSRAHGLIARALAISTVANGLSIVNLYLYSMAVGAGLSLPEIAVVAPVVLAIGMLPLSINGIGTIELTFVLLFGAMGVDSHVALAVALLRRLVLLLLSLVGGLLYAIRRFA
jgi:glycosyltransferase 2 family protein